MQEPAEFILTGGHGGVVEPFSELLPETDASPQPVLTGAAAEQVADGRARRRIGLHHVHTTLRLLRHGRAGLPDAQAEQLCFGAGAAVGEVQRRGVHVNHRLLNAPERCHFREPGGRLPHADGEVTPHPGGQLFAALRGEGESTRGGDGDRLQVQPIHQECGQGAAQSGVRGTAVREMLAFQAGPQAALGLADVKHVASTDRRVQSELSSHCVRILRDNRVQPGRIRHDLAATPTDDHTAVLDAREQLRTVLQSLGSGRDEPRLGDHANVLSSSGISTPAAPRAYGGSWTR